MPARTLTDRRNTTTDALAAMARSRATERQAARAAAQQRIAALAATATDTHELRALLNARTTEWTAR